MFTVRIRALSTEIIYTSRRRDLENLTGVGMFLLCSFLAREGVDLWETGQEGKKSI